MKVVTKESEETFNEQSNPDRWYYEVQNVTKLVLADDHEAIYQKLDVMLEVMKVLETSRKEAGIIFPGDNSGRQDAY